MVTRMRVKLGMSLLFAVTALFTLQGCSSSDPEEESLDASQQEEAADVAGLDGGVIGEDGAAITDAGSDVSALTDGMASGDGLAGDLTAGADSAAMSTPVGTKAAAAGDAVTGEFFNYTVASGDWLSKIAGRAYGDVHKWQEIAAANPNIGNPNHIFPGQVIKIPITGASSQAFADAYKSGAAH